MDLTNLPLDQEINDKIQAQSDMRNNEINNVLGQHYPNWKTILFYTLIFIFISIILAFNGFKLNGDTEGLFLPHLRIFIILTILSILFFSIWTIIKPSQPNLQLQGVVPYPTDTPLVPPDNTICGTTIVECTQSQDCSQCVEKDGSNKYSCTPLKGKKAYYEGSPLDPNKSYCLPTQSQKMISNCGTYTGKVVFTSGETEGWECQCLYPDIFWDNTDKNSQTCKTQIACATEEGTVAPLTNQDGSIVWDLNNVGTGLVDKTPYDVDDKGKPIFTCNTKGFPGYNVYPGDPFVLHKDNCYAGSTLSGSGVFDTQTMQCVCDGGDVYNQDRILTKSNITGYCYPNGIDVCKPHPITGICTFEIDILSTKEADLGIVFNWGGKTYIPWIKDKYEVIVDVSGEPNIIDPVYTIDNTGAKDLFYPYPKVKIGDLQQSDQTLIREFLGKNDPSKTENNINKILMYGLNGIPRRCNSYYYSQGDSYPSCDDKLNKQGYEFVKVCNDNICDSKDGQGNVISGSCVPNVGGAWNKDNNDLTKFYTCNCPNGDEFLGGRCIACLPDGTKNADPSRCCSQAIGKSCTPILGNDNWAVRCDEHHIANCVAAGLPSLVIEEIKNNLNTPFGFECRHSGPNSDAYNKQDEWGVWWNC